MTEMTPEAAKKLREKFPTSSVGKLPKGNTQLDYVGHAATTDRLLAVDPTWEPLALDERGLPAIDQAGNLWIRLTVCGLTRIGVGDGPSMKVRIGDAIRNAAMRYGVALDLWSKEELEGGHDAEVGQPQVGRGSQQKPRAVPEVSPLRAAQGRVWAASMKPEPDLTKDQRQLWVRGEIETRGINGSDPVALNKLADELAALPAAGKDPWGAPTEAVA